MKVSISSKNLKIGIVFSLLLFNVHISFAQNRLIAHWSFENIQSLDGTIIPTKSGSILTQKDSKPADPSPFINDESGNGNLLEVKKQKAESMIFSSDVPFSTRNGQENKRSLEIKSGEFQVSFHRSLPYLDLSKSWEIELSLKTNLLGTEQVFLTKEGAKGQLVGDVSIGFDNMQKRYFVEVFCSDNIPRRIFAGNEVKAGQWYDLRAHTFYDEKTDSTTLNFEVKLSSNLKFEEAEPISFMGSAMKNNAGLWIIGRGYPGGFPNSLAVLDGGIDEVKISGEALPRVQGQNPIFTDTFTADPAALVFNDTVYVYVGHDKASPGEWFNMPEWLCYSSSDMINWTPHGSVLKASDFLNANSKSAWAAQVVEKDGKFYFYVTLDRPEGHFITVAVSDKPTGPFVEATPGQPLITDDMTMDSHRANSDIDPTVFIDDDGTPWMMWGNGDFYMVKLNRNMVEVDGEITKVPFRNVAEGPWIFKRGDIYYNVYAADAPGVQPEQIAYASASNVTGPWTYEGLLTGPAKHGFTIHPAVIEFKDQWYFFYHDGGYDLNGAPGGDTRRQVCLEYLYFDDNGKIKPIELTQKGIVK
ncbi:glycoside hydrolase family 43 protein [Belliella sp. DSM 107340]|uniref:Glycoside hydrolase family 43 protein n=1 Tax=Belliella calami TaxID=2923436 RepID=A0ABS9UJ37_9BACT|nr:glycoside hydrolase family 43 protein [Belliella calami]MCH7396626.1 glycoside hydrolase family 43 protein [Belliella calami]